MTHRTLIGHLVALAMVVLAVGGGPKQQAVVQSVARDGVTYNSAGTAYHLRPADGIGSCQQLPDGTLRMNANGAGKLMLMLNDGER